MSPRARVLITDHPWPDVDLERRILDAAGAELVDPIDIHDGATLIGLAGTCDAILTCWAPIPAEMIANNPRLRVIARLGIGVDNIDVAAATRQGTLVTNVPGYCVEEVSDHVLALIYAWARGVVFYDRDVRAGKWAPVSMPLRRVSSLTVGVLGVGRIGKRVTEKLNSLGCAVVSIDSRANHPSHHTSPQWMSVISQCDVVTIHVPLNARTQHLVDSQFLSHMTSGSLLVNTSRGAIVDTEAMIDALAVGKPGAVALDVLENEPQVPGALLDLPNVILTPHVAFLSDLSLAELRRRASEEVVRVLRGEPPLHPVRAS